MKIILDWLSDVYQRYGYVAVLIAVAVIVALVLIVAQVGGVSVAQIAQWISGL